MKRKLVIISFLLMVFVMIINIKNISMAGSFDMFSKEVRRAPSSSGSSYPVTPEDPGTKPNIPSSPSTTVTKKYETFYTAISGNVFEDLKNMKSDIAKKTGMATTDGIKDGDEKGIANIRVELIDTNGVAIETTYTNQYGDYRFSPAPGRYRVKFYYGYYPEDKATDVNAVKNILKYNGQDYFSTAVGNSGNVQSSYVREIMISGKACTQVMLAIDCSASMSETLSDGKTRIAHQIDDAKKLVQLLLDDKNDNIYIGIVSFSDTSKLVQNLTTNKDRLIKKLDSLYLSSGATNIRGALMEANNAFVNTTEDSNRLIFLLSDGVPLSDGAEEIYEEDLSDDDVVREKLNTITSNTKRMMQNLISSGVNLVNLITKTYDEEIDQFTRNMCDVDGLQFLQSDAEDVTKIITGYVKELILASIKENTNEFSSYYSYVKGCDDIERREEVDSNFKIFDPTTTSLFEIIDNYDGSIDSKSLARDFSNLTYMTATTGEYTIDSMPSVSYTEDTITVNGTTYNKDEYSYSITEYYNQNLVLTLRPVFTLKTEATVSAFKLTLADGQNVFFDIDNDSAFVDSDLNNGQTRTLKNINDIVMVYYFDNELRQASTVEIEYTITIKNISSIPAKNVTLMVYIPNNLNFNSNSHLLTLPNYTNESFGWEFKEYNTPDNNEMICIATNLSDNELIRDFDIGENGERYAKVLFSKYLSVVSNNSDKNKDKDSNFAIDTEIFSYENEIGRRMQNVVSQDTADGQQIEIVSMYTANAKEIDHAQSAPVIVVPPTGKDYSQENLLYTLVILISLAIVIVVYKVRKRK